MADFYHKRFKYFLFYSCVERLKLYFPSCINPFHPIDYIDCNIIWKKKTLYFKHLYQFWGIRIQTKMFLINSEAKLVVGKNYQIRI